MPASAWCPAKKSIRTFRRSQKLSRAALQDQANKEARAAAQAVSSNAKDLSRGALRKEINERERKCKDMLHQHRFMRQTANRSEHTHTSLSIDVSAHPGLV